MKIKGILLIVAIMATVGVAYAQDDRPTFEEYLKSKQQGFNQYQKQKEDDFNAFRQQANAQFSAKMAEAWKLFNMEPPKEDPIIPDPDQPLVSDDKPVIPSLPVKPSGVIAPIPNEPHKPQQRPSPTLPEIPQPSVNMFTFNFFNTSCKVRLDNSLKFRLSNVDEESVSAVWQRLSGKASDALVEDCFRLIDEMQLCDWAAISLFKALGDAWLGKDSNEAVLMQMYLITQTGYKARIGRKGDNLVVLLAFDGQVFRLPYYKIDGVEFYNITEKKNDKGCYIFNMSFPSEQTASLRPRHLPALAESKVGSKTFSAKHYLEMTVKLSVNQNLMDFYATYPHCRWDNYVYAGLSENIKAVLYPVLRKAINGKSVPEAADRLLHFMHTAFNYKTDYQQFGYERSLFGDESFFHPYNDCEDRAILYSILVRDLLGVDVLLLEYSDHISTAVCFPAKVEGSYLEMDGKQYLLCDPTYIGSHIGQVAEPYRNVQPSVIKIQ